MTAPYLKLQPLAGASDVTRPCRDAARRPGHTRTCRAFLRPDVVSHRHRGTSARHGRIYQPPIAARLLCVACSEAMLLRVSLTLFFPLLSVHAFQDVPRPYELTVHRSTDSRQCTYLALRQTQIFRALPTAGHEKRKMLHTGEERFEFIHAQQENVWERAVALCGDPASWDFPTLIDSSLSLGPGISASSYVDPPELAIEPLITSGDSSNRVDLVFFSDGCRLSFFPCSHLSSPCQHCSIDTANEKGKFLEDALRLAEDISGNQTFYTVKPLLNFWAAFTPSKEVCILQCSRHS